ncbi:MAG: TetR/AcrR family transcriptional regulator [Caulobacteraceae bacterium]
MARTQSTDYEQRRSDIVEHAARLYAKRGFRGASVADIAKAGNISKSLIYHYFPSTRDILCEVMRSHVEALLETALAVRDLPIGPEDKLARLLRDFVALYANAADRQTVLLNELDELSNEARTVIVEVQRRIISTIESILLEVRPDLRSRAKRRTITMLILGTINWLHTWYDPKGQILPDEISRIASDLLLTGLVSLKL